MFKCKTCGKEFQTRQALGGHASSHSRGENYRSLRKSKYYDSFCEVCGKPIRTDGSTKCCSWDCRLKRLSSRPAKIDSGKGYVDLDITAGELKKYKEEHFVCEICGRKETSYTGSSNKNKRKEVNNLCVDHRHSDNHFRGLLCRKCNYFLGWYENLEPIIQEYLKR